MDKYNAPQNIKEALTLRTQDQFNILLFACKSTK